MDKNNLNISKVEDYLYKVLKSKVSENLYVGTLPDTTQSTWSDMCLIDCGNGFRDYDAYGKGTVLIWLYAKPLSNGQKNVKLMYELELGLNKAISQADSKIYRINRGNVYCDYDSTRRWHCNIVELNLLIC